MVIGPGEESIDESAGTEDMPGGDLPNTGEWTDLTDFDSADLDPYG